MQDIDHPGLKSLFIKLKTVEGKYGEAYKWVNKYIKEYPYDAIFIAQKVEILVGRGEKKLAEELLKWLRNNGIEDKRFLLQLKSIEKGNNNVAAEEKQGDTLEKRILAIKLFDSVGYNSYKERAIAKAQKGVKTEEEKDLVNKAIEIIEKQKVDSISTEDKNIEQPGENIGGDSR